ncbi:hypothetical protein NPIL_82321 [Nephila pilipes]|uniref:Uncharacterized protein n=1 Tax=Nephila pilipes TaxID=299642 RepID=A0A8X6QZB0_NEPPI|nr:hypothetical protein NPIL_82321 [Nephila pilipes]
MNAFAPPHEVQDQYYKLRRLRGRDDGPICRESWREAGSCDAVVSGEESSLRHQPASIRHFLDPSVPEITIWPCLIPPKAHDCRSQHPTVDLSQAIALPIPSYW